MFCIFLQRRGLESCTPIPLSQKSIVKLPLLKKNEIYISILKIPPFCCNAFTSLENSVMQVIWKCPSSVRGDSIDVGEDSGTSVGRLGCLFIWSSTYSASSCKSYWGALCIRATLAWRWVQNMAPAEEIIVVSVLQISVAYGALM